MRTIPFGAVGLAALFGVVAILGVAPRTKAQVTGDMCAGLPTEVREAGFFGLFGQQVEEVQSLTRPQRTGKIEFSRTAGVRLFLTPTPGLTTPYLQRVLECHIADVAGGDPRRDPLALPGVTAKVTEGPRHLVVDIEAPTFEAGRGLSAATRRALETARPSNLEPPGAF
jgi:hypothetical protein